MSRPDQRDHLKREDRQANSAFRTSREKRARSGLSAAYEITRQEWLACTSWYANWRSWYSTITTSSQRWIEQLLDDLVFCRITTAKQLRGALCAIARGELAFGDAWCTVAGAIKSLKDLAESHKATVTSKHPWPFANCPRCAFRPSGSK